MTGHDLPRNFEADYRAHVDALFNSSLEPFANVRAVLQDLELPMCIASSGPQEKIASALRKTGLDDIFSGRTYSSYDIEKWKPDPSLFLYAASEIGVLPQSCLVVEDSTVGIEAAKLATMTPLQFCKRTSAIEGVENFSDYQDFARKLSLMSKSLGY